MPVGIWAVVTTTFGAGKASSSVRLYRATAKKAVALGRARPVRAPSGPSAPRPAAGVPRVSVAPVVIPGLGDVSGLLITDVFGAGESDACKMHVVEDRESPYFQAILAEARLRASRYIDPADARPLKESIERTVSDANLFEASEAFGRDAVAKLCKFPPSLRLTISSNDTLNVSGATFVTVWNGVFEFPLQALQKSSAVYSLTTREIAAWSTDITAGDCAGTLAWSGTADAGEGSITLRRLPNGGLTYFVSYAWFRSTLVDGSLTCVGQEPPVVPYSTPANAPVVISERPTPALPADESGPIGVRTLGGPPMNATWTLAAP